jgi:osmoprotectant transport system permease protein
MSEDLIVQFSRLPDRLSAHVLLTIAALTCGILISIPLAILATRKPALRGTLVGIAGVVQTIPSLAILALMVPLLGQIGFVPAFIALVLYSILPILRNTVTGLQRVDANVIEAARGVGMSDGQILRRVQFPLALAMIIAGIRTSAVWVVGIATLSTPVGQTSLGDYIFQGLQLRNNVAVIVGCVAAAALAIVLDSLIRMIEIGVERSRRSFIIIASVSLLALCVGGIYPMFRGPVDARIGAKSFTEQFILAEIVRNRLAEEGYSTSVTRGMGSTILFESLTNGSTDVYIDYTGTIWSNVMKRSDIFDAETTFNEVKTFLKQTHGIETVGRIGFENAYALAMRRDVARERNIRSIADLAAHSGNMTIAGDYEFFGRPEWTSVEKTYGVRFNKTTGMDSTLMYTALRDRQVDVISAFSTDGRITAFDLLVLEDPQNALPPYDAVILVSKKMSQNKRFLEALRPLVGSISDERMRELNKQVDLDGALPIDAARYK